MTNQKLRNNIAGARIVIDGAYFRNQVLEAMRAFIAPLNGVITAAMGVKSQRSFSDKPRGQDIL